MQKVLFVASEAHPLIKTGGLADVCGSLPPALLSLGWDVRLLLPGYHDALANAGRVRTVAQLAFPGLASPVTLREGRLPGTRIKTWFVDYPPAYERPGNPYLNPAGHPWQDNAQRFALLARVATAIATGQAGLKWQPALVHGHDWQAGLVPVLLSLESRRPATVFTVHNLAYQGLFPYSTFIDLELPSTLWSYHALEFHGQLSFMKGGLVFADRITTVSPTYAKEIQTPEFGCGLDGLLRHRRSRLSGIVNGIDEREWNPARDSHLAQPYQWRRLAGKVADKKALQGEFGLPKDPNVPLIGAIGRLVHQKGIDLVLDALPRLLADGAQMVVLGNGEAKYEYALLEASERYPRRLGLRIGFDEGTAHRIEAGADFFLMPSRFEPCGLNQMYSQRYGTIPIVHRVGGLADTVVDATPENLDRGTATGIAFDDEDADTLLAATMRALALYRDKAARKRVMVTGMRQDFSWRHSAQTYSELYEAALRDV